MLGIAWRLWWVIPLIGGAAGALPGLLEGFGVHVFAPLAKGNAINVAGLGIAACVMLGLVIGVVICLRRLKHVKRLRHGMTQRQSVDGNVMPDLTRRRGGGR